MAQTHRNSRLFRKEDQQYYGPKLTTSSSWRSFDEDLGKILEATLSGDVARKLRVMTTIVYNLGKERFGTPARNACKLVTNKTNRHEREIQILGKDLKALTRQCCRATAETTGICKLTDEVRTKLIRLRKADTIRKARKKRAGTRAQFVKDPYKFTKNILSKTIKKVGLSM